MRSIEEIILSNSDNEGQNLIYYTEALPDWINNENLEKQILFLSNDDYFISIVNSYHSELTSVQARKSHVFLNPYTDIVTGAKPDNKVLYNAPELIQNFDYIKVTDFNEKLLEVSGFSVSLSDGCIISYLGEIEDLHAFCFIKLDSSDIFSALDTIRDFSPENISSDYNVRIKGFRKAFRYDDRPKIYLSIGNEGGESENNADNPAIAEITAELQSKIKGLIAQGFEPLVYRCIREAIAESNLSISAKNPKELAPAPIHISFLNRGDCHCFIKIPDYQIRDIPLKPLHKAVYLLYLKHPEGIINRDQHEVELLKLYARVGGTRADSVHNFCDFSHNSFYEVLSRIRSAFVQLMDEGIASNYFISSDYNGAKKINLPPELIVWE